jgi:RNA polymerase sigma factor (sigma-70 family)
MPSRPLSAVVQQLRAAGRDGAGRTDGELLTQFLSRRDEDALAALVERHAPMVWGVCCRLLRNPHDVEDAFQATFLVFVQKAATVVPREMVANWLYGVAQQTAVRLRATVARRGGREVQMNVLPEPAVAGARDEELLSLLDQELSRLPERFRALIVLCDLEGHTRKEVARQLGCPEGTVASGLARARELLAKRLARRGLAVSSGSLAATLSHSGASASVPPTVVTSTINVATLLAAGKAAGVISGPVATLTQGMLKTMFLKKITATAVAVLALGVAVIAGGSLAIGQTEGTGKPMVGKDVKPPMGEKPAEPAAKQEKEAFTAWGKEVGGVQAGLGYLPGEKRTYHTGETVAVVLRVRNVGKEELKFSYFREEFYERPPAVTDEGGKPVPLEGVSLSGWPKRIEVNLAPGKEVNLSELHLVLRPASERGKERPISKLFGTGKFQLQCDRAGGNIQDETIGPDAVLSKLVTGKLELEVKEPEKVPPEKEAFAAWGQEVGGLQAGLSINNADEIPIGGKVKAVVKLRNVSKETIKVSARPLWMSYPGVVDSRGNRVRKTTAPQPLFSIILKSLTLKPGETVEVGKTDLVVAELDQQVKVPDGVVDLCAIHVEPGKYKADCIGFLKEHPALATGAVEFEVKPAKNEGLTAWGKEVGGLQAGLGFAPGQKRAYTIGETVRIFVRVRNVGKETVEFNAMREFFVVNPPAVTQANGESDSLHSSGSKHQRGDDTIRLAPGKETDLYDWTLAIRPRSEKGNKPQYLALYGTGEFQFQYESLQERSTAGVIKSDPTLSKLGTGKLELEVQEAPAEKQRPLSSEEATRMTEGSKLTVEFRVESVTRAVLIQSESKQEGWATGHGPDDRCLRPPYPKDKAQARFLSILTPNAITQLNKAGIRDIEMHFNGKTVRVTGAIVIQDYRGRGTPREVEIVVNDLSQLEVVN